MGFAINNNLAANNTYRSLNNNQNDLSKSLEKLSTGLRINRAADDAAGLSISEGLRAQVSGLDQAGRNAQDGISMIQTAEGALTEIHSILGRMRDLSVQGANDSNNEDAREAITKEATQLGQELDRIIESTNFNGIKLLDNSAGTGLASATATAGTINIQVGADGTGHNVISVALGNTRASLGDTAGDGTTGLTASGTTVADFNVDSTFDAQATTVKIDTAITAISAQRAELGASQNRLESASKSIAVAKENLGASESRIRDTDMAAEMVKYTKTSILAQAGTAMLAQANQANQGVLQLLR